MDHAYVFCWTFFLLLAGCAQTSHGVRPAELGSAVDWPAWVSRLGEPGPVELERVVAADWQVDRGGLINLDHPRARAVGLADGSEPIQVYMYALRHPKHGLFIVDAGVDRATASEDTEHMAASWLVRSAMNLDALHTHVTTGDWLAQQAVPLAGGFLTHLHLDHILGVQDVPNDVPIYVGPGEAQTSRLLHVFSRSTVDATLLGKGPLQELAMQPTAGAPFKGVLDVWGDGSLIALHVPGHTDGSLAFLVRTPSGPVLLTGDTCHTRWGWDHGVESGSYNTHPEQSATTFHVLKRFADAHPELTVYLGHQDHRRSGARPTQLSD